MLKKKKKKLTPMQQEEINRMKLAAANKKNILLHSLDDTELNMKQAEREKESVKSDRLKLLKIERKISSLKNEIRKKKEGLFLPVEIAGQKEKGCLYWQAYCLPVVQYVCLCPYWAIYEILKELLSHGGNPPGADGEAVIRWGWTAFGGLVGGLVLLYAALMSSHVAAFRILYGLRVRLSEHIGKLPLGYLSNTSTGAIKKTMEQNVEKIEGFIAHTIPDLVNVVATEIFYVHYLFFA